MIEIELAGQRGRMANGSGWNGNEAVASATSEAFVNWLYCQYASAELPSVGTYHFATRNLVRQVNKLVQVIILFSTV